MNIRRGVVAAPIRHEGGENAKSGSIPTPKQPLAIEVQHSCGAEQQEAGGIREIH